MKRSVERDWDPVATSLLDYRRRARNREALTNCTLCGIGLAFICLFVAIAVGVSTFLSWIFATLSPHLPAIAWTAPSHKSLIAIALSLF